MTNKMEYQQNISETEKNGVLFDTKLFALDCSGGREGYLVPHLNKVTTESRTLAPLVPMAQVEGRHLSPLM